jgi:hypothetical protein
MCAVELRKRALPFLSGLSLGRICHFVRLAEEAKELLGTSGDGGLVPFARSVAKHTQDCAKDGVPSCSGAAYTSLQQAAAHLKGILQASQGPLPMSNVKRRLKAQHDLTLSETAFGHTSMLKLLQEEPTLSELCVVTKETNGYFVSLKPLPPPTPILLSALLGGSPNSSAAEAPKASEDTVEADSGRLVGTPPHIQRSVLDGCATAPAVTQRGTPDLCLDRASPDEVTPAETAWPATPASPWEQQAVLAAMNGKGREADRRSAGSPSPKRTLFQVHDIAAPFGPRKLLLHAR